MDNNGQILGQLITPLALPVEASIPEFPIFAAGTVDITVASETNLSLQAGNYRNIKLNGGTTANPTRLILQGGVFNISNLDLGDKTRVECSPAAPHTDCEIRIKNRLEPGPSSYIGRGTATNLTAMDIRVFVEGINGNTGGLDAAPKAATIGDDNTVIAHIFAPNGTLLIRQGGSATGIFIAKDAQIGINVIVKRE